MEKDNHFMDEELEQDDNKLHLRKFFADKGKFLFHKNNFTIFNSRQEAFVFLVKMADNPKDAILFSELKEKLKNLLFQSICLSCNLSLFD
jgi:hypothetical protein